MEIKWFVLAVLIVVGLILGLASRGYWAGKLKMSTGLFNVMNILGIVCGVTGLVVTLLWPRQILEKHYFELILLPFFLIIMLIALIQIMQRPREILDEKQNQNALEAAALTWSASVFAVFIMYAFYDEGALTGPVFFPLYVFFSIAFFSATTLYLFHKS